MAAARGSRATTVSAAVAVVGALLGSVGTVRAAPAAPVVTPVDAGQATVAEPDASREITEAGSAAPFTLLLPDDAECPGDSANDQWRLQSFVVPSGVDMSAIEFDGYGPVVDGGMPLFRATSEPFTDFLAENEDAGQPGQMLEIPAFSMFVFTNGELQPGSYRIGLACTYFRELGPYWDAEIEIASAPDDEPAGFTWKVTSDPGPAKLAGGRSSLNPMGFAAIGVLCVAAALFVYTFRRDRAPRASAGTRTTS